MKLSFLSIFSLLTYSSVSFGAACCGGGFAAPSVITGDDRAQFTSSVSYSQVAIDNVDNTGTWRTWDDHQSVQTLRFEGAHIISDRWQVGGSLPVVQRTRLDQRYSGLGDASGMIAYEYLPDWSYNPWRPKGVGYLQLTLPTGKSKADSEVGGLDSRGNGFFAFGAGTILTKAVGRWDLFSSVEIHRAFERSIANSQIQGSLVPGFGGNFSAGAGFNTASTRLGGSITWSYEDPVNIIGSTKIDGSLERFATAVISASYLWEDELAGTLSYSDQTLFGSPLNTSLGRTVSLAIQKRWLR